MSETERIADQLIRAFEGDTWSGRSIKAIVADLPADVAANRRLPGSHSAWELLGHIRTWIQVAEIRIGGQAHDPTDQENFGTVTDQSPAAWARQWQEVEASYRSLAATIRRLPDERLDQPVAGRSYSGYHLLHGVIQHSLYHAGQIALLDRVPDSL